MSTAAPPLAHPSPPARPVRSAPRADAGRRPRLATIVGVAAALVLLAGAIGWLGSRGTLGADHRDTSSADATTGGADRGAAGSSRSAGSSGAVASDSALTGRTAPSTAGEGSSAAPDPSSDAGRTGATVAPKIVRTGSVDLVVKRRTFADASRDLRAIAEGAGGYVAASDMSSHQGTPTGSLTMRVPVD